MSGGCAVALVEYIGADSQDSGNDSCREVSERLQLLKLLVVIVR